MWVALQEGNSNITEENNVTALMQGDDKYESNCHHPSSLTLPFLHNFISKEAPLPQSSNTTDDILRNNIKTKSMVCYVPEVSDSFPSCVLFIHSNNTQKGKYNGHPLFTNIDTMVNKKKSLSDG